MPDQGPVWNDAGLCLKRRRARPNRLRLGVRDEWWRERSVLGALERRGVAGDVGLRARQRRGELRARLKARLGLFRETTVHDVGQRTRRAWTGAGRSQWPGGIGR